MAAFCLVKLFRLIYSALPQEMLLRLSKQNRQLCDYIAVRSIRLISINYGGYIFIILIALCNH